MIKAYQTRCWITRVIESRFLSCIENRLLKSIIIFALIPDINIIRFFIVKNEHITGEFFIGYFFAFVLFNIGPYLVWLYDEKLLPDFFRKSCDLVSDRERITKLYRKYSRLFSTKSWLVIVPEFIFLFPIWIHGLPVAMKGGFLGFDDPDYWISLLYTIWLLIFTSFFAGAGLVTIFAVKEISTGNLKIDPLHPDKLGGLNFIGDLAIGTTMMLSMISFLIPLGFVIGSYIKVAPYVYTSTFLFILFILLSFLYPTFSIHHKAKIIRDGILEKLRREYNSSYRNIEGNYSNDIDQIKHHLQLQKLRSRYMDYKSLSLYPFETEIFLKLLSSVILPIAFLLIEKFNVFYLIF